MLFQRFIHGLWLATTSVVGVLIGGTPFLAILSSITTVAMGEWLVLSSRNALKPYKSLGILLILTFSCCIFWMRSYNDKTLLRLFVIVWSTDVGAYFFGKTFEGPKLTLISPNKTLAGFLGGLQCGILAGYLSGYSILGSVILSLASQIGDLAESAAKRKADVKDSNLQGLSIPGHGGLLDRIDGLLFATPLAFLGCHF